MCEEGEESNANVGKKVISKSDSRLSPLSRYEAISEPEAHEVNSRPSTPSTRASPCGSGRNGQLLGSDFTTYTESSSSSIRSAAPSSGHPLYTDMPTSAMRRALAVRLTDSKRDIPHYYLASDIQMDRLTSLRASLSKAATTQPNSAQGAAQAPPKLTINDFVIKGVALACADVPEVNAEWHGEFIRQFNTIDISVVVATSTGICVPVVRDVGSKGLNSISSQVKALAEKARNYLLTSDDHEGGGFMVSNLGMYGSVSNFTSIIKPPQTCTLAIGGLHRKLVMDATSERGFKEIEMMKVTLALDHRALDGAVGARWLKAFKGHMENPVSFML